MQILGSQVTLASCRQASTTDFSRTTSEAWIGPRPVNGRRITITSGGTGQSAAQVASELPIASVMSNRAEAVSSLSDQARAALNRLASQVSNAPGPADPADESSDDPTLNDPNLRTLLLLIEALTGHKARIIKPGQVPTNAGEAARAAGRRAAASNATMQNGPANEPAGWGVDVKVEQVHQESETTGFAASGQAVTADGRTIAFELAQVLHRDEMQVTTTEVQAGDAVKKIDPIALNLQGGPIALSEAGTAFDIDSDGAAEQVALPAPGTYFVALDRSGNGTIDDGSELFGPGSGNGFAELRSLDSDGNGWIDEGDPAFGALRLWSGPSAEMASLAGAGVGALYVGASTATQFDLKSGSNQTLGQIRSSSLYLREDGQPGTLSQVDLTA
jgi:hypothetical protein